MSWRWARLVVVALLALPLIQCANAVRLALGEPELAGVTFDEWLAQTSENAAGVLDGVSESMKAGWERLYVARGALDRFAEGAMPTSAPTAYCIGAALLLLLRPRGRRPRSWLPIGAAVSGVAAVLLQLGSARREWYVGGAHLDRGLSLQSAMTTLCSSLRS